MESETGSSILIEHDLFRKPASSFRDHALKRIPCWLLPGYDPGDHGSGEALMRLVAFVFAGLAIAGFTSGVSASGKIRLAQTSVTTTCMMTCNAQAASCQAPDLGS
jgi:hypothetical protein